MLLCFALFLHQIKNVCCWSQRACEPHHCPWVNWLQMSALLMLCQQQYVWRWKKAHPLPYFLHLFLVLKVLKRQFAFILGSDHCTWYAYQWTERTVLFTCAWCCTVACEAREHSFHERSPVLLSILAYLVRTCVDVAESQIQNQRTCPHCWKTNLCVNEAMIWEVFCHLQFILRYEHIECTIFSLGKKNMVMSTT